MKNTGVLHAAGQLNDADAEGPSVTLALESQSCAVPKPIGRGHPSPSHLDAV